MVKEFNQRTSHKNVAILAIIGSEISGEGQILHDFPGRGILNPITGRGLITSSFFRYHHGNVMKLQHVANRYPEEIVKFQLNRLILNL